MFTLDASGRGFLKDGRPHFFRLDTAWMALFNLTVDEFKEYALFRKSQGYNALLLQNTPAFHDAPANIRYFPFLRRGDGEYDLSVLSEEYFAQAREKVAFLNELGIMPFIAVMWGVFIKGNNQENAYDCTGKQFERFEDYARAVDYSIELYRPYHPVWLIGGDTLLDDESEINYEYYSYMGRRIRELCPGDLMGAHLAGGSSTAARYNGFIDFYTYQSGHCYNGKADLMLPAQMALREYGRLPKKPVLNLEPMYEAHGFGNRFGRFDALFLRRAFWYSVLSGAKAGFAYGAHGIWMFYDGAGFNNENWSKEPLPWRSALRLQGSYDVMSSADLFERLDMRALEPAQELNLTPYDEVRVAANPSRSLVVLYTPCTCRMELGIDLSGYRCTWHVLGEKISCVPEIRVIDGETVAREMRALSRGQRHPAPVPEALERARVVSQIKMYGYNSDAVLVCERS